MRYSGKGVLLDIMYDICVHMVLTGIGGIRRALGLRTWMAGVIR